LTLGRDISLIASLSFQFKKQVEKNERKNNQKKGHVLKTF
jgi:hypothetical protein